MTDGERTVLALSGLLGQAVVAKDGQQLGKISDVIVRLPEPGAYPVVSGLIAKVSGRDLYVSMKKVDHLVGPTVRLRSAKIDVRPFERREGEVLLRMDLLGHRLIDLQAARLVRARDLELTHVEGSWRLTSLDTSLRRRLLGVIPLSDLPHEPRDWSEFEPLIGHAASALRRNPLVRLRRMRPAQIADLVEDADKQETAEILDAVHVDRELEADVFEEMESDRQIEVLRGRTDADIADVLVNMRADDAADLIAELPQMRRRPVLELLPAQVQAKIRALLGFNPATAGGLMNPDFLALTSTTSVREALIAVGRARTIPHEVLASIYVTDSGRVVGAVTLAGLLQAEQGASLAEVSDSEPVKVSPQADVTEVAVKMTDFNLLTLPVVGDDDELLGVITVDDVLEATVPEEWWRREDGADRAESRPAAPAPGAPHLTASGP